ncbi:hypothetical protein D0Y65_034482 [Glycine soja]|uniref:Uncharacterized protein n=1 Tax=Glycine soja TaxID=3848 RepID=A0A445HQP7_GLYSO|nr:hypothetical protein D0Y65_034482 [Glycine soja]
MQPNGTFLFPAINVNDIVTNNQGCKSRGIKLCGALAPAGMIVAWTSKCLPNYQREKYVVVTIVDCRTLLDPVLPSNHAASMLNWTLISLLDLMAFLLIQYTACRKVGQVVFTADDVEEWHAQRKSVILIELKTTPADFRFPTTNQTRHCFTDAWQQRVKTLVNLRDFLNITAPFARVNGVVFAIGVTLIFSHEMIYDT